MLVGLLAGLLGLVGVLFYLLLLGRARRSRHQLPPQRSGLVPWLGCALAFGKEPLFFIQKTRKEVRNKVEVSYDVLSMLGCPMLLCKVIPTRCF